jgi:hypothetical protein
MSAVLNLGDKITAGNRADATFFYKKRVADDSGTLLTEAETDANNRELLAQKLFDKASIVYTAGGVKASKAYSVKGTDFTVTRAGVKNVIGRDGVLTEIPANTPATEFSGGVLKGTLIEPSATNSLLHSNDLSNLYWTKNNLDPESISDAKFGTIWKLNDTADNSRHWYGRDAGLASTGSANSTMYAKAGNLHYIKISHSSSVDTNTFTSAILVDLINGSVVSQGGDCSNISVRNVGDGWFEIKFASNGSIAPANTRYYVSLLNNDQEQIYIGGSGYVYIRGNQRVNGTLAPTSLIDTTGSAITQPADVITATGVSGLIGQTEGTVLLEVDLRAGKSNTARIITVADNNFVNGFILNQRTQNDFEVIFRVNDVNLSTRIFSGNIVTGKYRIGIKYQLGESFNLFVNGSKLADGNVFSGFSSPLDRFYLGTRQQGDVQFNDTTPQALIFKQALTDQEIQTWTTL